MNLLRSVSLFSFVSLALSAQAALISVGTVGTSSYDPVTRVVTNTETVDPSVGQSGGFGPLTNLTLLTSNVTITGTGTYTNLSTGDSLSFSYVVSPGAATPQSYSAPASWIYTGGTGSYAGLTGSGTLNINYSGDLATFGAGTSSLVSRTNFSGDLQPVPEPTSTIALGMGAVAILGRRKGA